MGITFTCDKCGSVSNMAYSMLRTRKDVGKSPYGELYIPCRCGGNKFAPYRIINGQIAPVTNGFNSVQKVDPLAKYRRMMGGL